ncbi:hypothetical protein CXB51_034645 [Gossypium anomalum]|uniref:Aminotransferase-like plant mobile domain-containing protein n=1 Tax=Gossypium anomalum TaxID=47600 RepID=A0A8J5Y6C0_9ROSI|nr:hypothetical protein CXB51_034645 [Gossypium anomalum]
MSSLPSPLIENYLREVGFWHAATIGQGCKLDPKLISALIERLPVDGATVTRSVQSADWEAICYDLLGAILDNIYGGQIEMSWLQDTFPELGNDLIELERIRYAGAYILEMIGCYLMPDLSRNLIHLRWLLKLVDFRVAGKLSWGSTVLAPLYREMCRATSPNKAKFGGCLSLLQSWAEWNHLVSYVGIPTALEDIRFLLDQRSEAQFQWTPYEDPAIRAVISEEFFQNPNIWYVNVPLSEYIKIWENRYNHIPDHEPIIVPELACTPDYMSWFRIHGKAYLLLEKQRRRQIYVERKQRGPLNLRGMDDRMGPSTAPTQSLGPSTVPTQSPGSMPQPTTPTSHPLQIMLGTYPSPYMYFNPYMFPFPSPMPSWNVWPDTSPFPMTFTQPMIYRPSSPEGSHGAPSVSSSPYHSPLPYGWCKHLHILYSTKVGPPLNTHNWSNQGGI